MRIKYVIALFATSANVNAQNVWGQFLNGLVKGASLGLEIGTLKKMARAWIILIICLFSCNYAKGQSLEPENPDTLFQYFKNYHNGINGCFMNREKALGYLIKSANMGNLSAQKELGQFYFNGVHIPKMIRWRFIGFIKVLL